MAPDIRNVQGFDELLSRIKDANSIEDWSFILSDYITWGNNKIHKSVGIFNMNAASDCPNLGTKENGASETGYCQVAKDECYAVKAEEQYPNPLPYRRRQEYLWDCLDANTWAKAFLQIVERKRNDVSAIRFSEAGDFRHRGDIIKVDRIAEILSQEGIDVYTYSASHKLEWSEAEHFKVMQSNNMADYGDNSFLVVETEDDIPDKGVQCAYEGANIKCGKCSMCINKDFEKDVYITLH